MKSTPRSRRPGQNAVASSASILKPRIVLDTNILVFALLSPFGAPAKVVDMMLSRKIIACYDGRIAALRE